MLKHASKMKTEELLPLRVFPITLTSTCMAIPSMQITQICIYLPSCHLGASFSKKIYSLTKK